MDYGLYKVTGRRRYRGHEPGTTFTARLDRGPAQRALMRGDIVLLEWITPTLPDTFTFPRGWLPGPQSVHPEAPRGASLVRR